MLSELDKSIQYSLDLLNNDKEGLTTKTDLLDPNNPSIDWEMVYPAMKDYDLIKDVGDIVLLTPKGESAASIGWNNFKNNIEQEQLKEDEESYELKSLEIENARLTKENLELQNRQLKRSTIYAIIGFILGAIITNAEIILDLLNIKSQEP